jgi:YbbR domain-containing protein
MRSAYVKSYRLSTTPDSNASVDKQRETYMLRRLLNNVGSITLALVLAIVVWVIAVNEENPIVEDGFSEAIPIEIVNQPEGTIIFGDVVNKVQLTLRASQASWDELGVNKFRAQADLAGLEAGVHDVEVQVTCSDDSIRIVEKKPEKITIRLEELKEKEVEVRVNILDSPPLGYSARPASATPSEVKITGPASMVDQVVTAVVDFFLRNAKDTVERRVDLSLRDAQDSIVSWVTPEPAQVTVQVPIEQRWGYKEVAVRTNWEGQVAPGYRITNVSVDPSIVTVTGSPGALREIPGYLETAPVDVSNASADVVARMPLVLPEGVSLPLAGSQGVTVTVNVTAIESKLTLQSELIIQGLSPGLKAIPSPKVVNVTLSGSLPKLDTLKPENVQVTLDLFDLPQGAHKVVPAAIAPEGITVESILPDTIEVEISIAPTPTSTP